MPMRILTAAMLLLASSLGANAQVQSGTSAEKELRAVMAQLRTAALQGDSETAASLMAEEYLQTDISGHVQDKQEWFKEYFNPLASLIKANKFHWDTYERKNLLFRFYSESAVVVGELEAKGTGARWMPKTHTWEADPNATFSGTLHFTHVYVKRDGRWLLAALHNAIPVAVPAGK